MTKQIGEMVRLNDMLGLYTGMSSKEIKSDLEDKARVLKWMVSKKYFDINAAGKITADYYLNADTIIDAAKKDKDWP